MPPCDLEAVVNTPPAPLCLLHPPGCRSYRAPFCSSDLPSSFSPLGSALAASSAQSMPPPDVQVAPSSLLTHISAQLSLYQWDLPWPYKLEKFCFLPTAVSITSTFLIFCRALLALKNDAVHLFLIWLLPSTCKFLSVLFTLYAKHIKQYIFEVLFLKIIIVSQKIVKKKKKSAEKRTTKPKVVFFKKESIKWINLDWAKKGGKYSNY